MADNYTALYGAGEISEVTIDTIVGVGASFVGFVSIIGLIILYTWVRRRI